MNSNTPWILRTAVATALPITALLCGSVAHAATIDVNSSSDSDEVLIPVGKPPISTCTLRMAIRAANENRKVNGCVAGETTTVDTIRIGARTVLLTSSLPLITTGVQIYGAGYERTFIDGQRQAQVAFSVKQTGNLVLSGVSLTKLNTAGLLVDTGTTASFSNARITDVGSGNFQTACMQSWGTLYIDNAEFIRCDGFRGSALGRNGVRKPHDVS